MTVEQAIEEQEKLKQAEKQIMEGVQKELKEKNDALSGLLGPGGVRKSRRGPRKRRNGAVGDEESDSESELDEEEREKKKQQILANRKSLHTSSKKSTMRAGLESSRILNIKNGKLKQYRDSYHQEYSEHEDQ